MHDFCERFSRLLPDIFQNKFSVNPLRSTLIKWNEQIENFMTFYYSLGDESSKTLFFKLLRYNIGFSFSGLTIQDKYAIYSNHEWNKLLKNAQEKKWGG